MRSNRHVPLWQGGLAGAGAGCALFMVEAAAIARSGAIGLGLDVDGVFRDLFRVVQPALLSLGTRVLGLYLLGGAGLGVAAAVLAVAVAPRTRLAAWGVWALELVVLGSVWTSWAAIERPALVDDVAFLGPVARGLARSGEPWHCATFAVTWLGVHLALAIRSRGARWVLRWGILLSSLAAGGWAVARLEGPRGKWPLLVVIGLDAFRPDRLSAFGGQGDVAPNVEQFLADATLFERAYTPIAQTEPAWRSLLTARWPFRGQVRYPLTADERVLRLPTFPRQLGQAGYATAFYTDCSRFNFQGPLSGFDVRSQPPRGALNFALEKLRFRALGLFADNTLGSLWLPELVDNRAMAGLYNPYRYARQISRELVDKASRGPFLFAFHSAAAHFPGDPALPFYRRFLSESAPHEKRVRMSFAPIGQDSQGDGDRESAILLYDELLAQADAQFGILVQALKDADLYEDAVIVVFSDHGESFHDDLPKLWGRTPVHGARLSDDENRVLLALKLPRNTWPASKVRRRVPEVVSLIDLGPTLLELAGATPMPEIDGRSLVGLLKDKKESARRVYMETGFTHASPDALEPSHLALVKRGFESYRVRGDGRVEVSAEVHDQILREKDVGALDGQGWLIRSPQKDGTVRQGCRGVCDPSLEAWLTALVR